MQARRSHLTEILNTAGAVGKVEHEHQSSALDILWHGQERKLSCAC